MACLAFLCLVALPVATHQLTYSSSRSLESTELSAELAARRALAARPLLDGLEADMAHISAILQSNHGAASLMQVAAEDREMSAPPFAKAVAAPQPSTAKATKQTAHKKKAGIDAATAVKEMDKLKPAQMPAMLGLLTGMYDSWKEKIGEANKKEHDQKTIFDKTIKDLEVKKAMYKDSKDAMDTYNRIEAYWKKQRSISHRQYHTALKIMHSGMQKFKSVSQAMSTAIAGKKPSTKDLQTIGMAMPNVVLLQQEVVQLTTWMQDASHDLQGAKELSSA